jgi:acetate kinase
MNAGRGTDSDTIIVLNSGSSSVKFAAFTTCTAATTTPERLLHGEIDGIGKSARLVAWNHDGTSLRGDDIVAAEAAPQGHENALRMLFEWLEKKLPAHRVSCVSHRIVHGGQHFTEPTRITPEVLTQLDALSPLAPLHQPHNLAAIRVIARLKPTLPQIACFDTAFHAGQEWIMQAYALPRRIRDAGIRRYGFHGLSYEYIASAIPDYLGMQAEGRVVVAHLGNGASLCGLHKRRSVATTMGFTALDGLMMGTRCGNLDPGVVVYLADEMHLDTADITKLLYQESGLLGVSEISSDMRTLENSADPRAAAAIDLFVHRIVRDLGSVAAALGGMDALVFTAGIGEHSAMVRARVCEAVAWLGIELDAQANQVHTPRISNKDSRVSAWIIPTNEELMLAQHAQAVLAHGGS